MNDRLKHHLDYVYRMKSRGHPVRFYSTPCCAKRIEDIVPAVADIVWDSLAECPFCGEMYMKIARHDGITALVPED